MKYNLSISAAFMQFLAKVTGGNAAAGVGSSVVALEAKLKLLDTALKRSQEGGGGGHCQGHLGHQHGRGCQDKAKQALPGQLDP